MAEATVAPSVVEADINGTTTPSTSCGFETSAAPTFGSFVLYRTIIEVYLVSGLCVAGVVGNLLSMIVLRRDRDRPNATNWLLQVCNCGITLLQLYVISLCQYVCNKGNESVQQLL